MKKKRRLIYTEIISKKIIFKVVPVYILFLNFFLFSSPLLPKTLNNENVIQEVKIKGKKESITLDYPKFSTDVNITISQSTSKNYSLKKPLKIHTVNLSLKDNSQIILDKLVLNPIIQRTFPKIAFVPDPKFAYSLPKNCFFLSNEAYPDFSVGSSNWAHDITGSFAYYMQAFDNLILLQNEMDANSEAILQTILSPNLKPNLESAITPINLEPLHISLLPAEKKSKQPKTTLSPPKIKFFIPKTIQERSFYNYNFSNNSKNLAVYPQYSFSKSSQHDLNFNCPSQSPFLSLQRTSNLTFPFTYISLNDIHLASNPLLVKNTFPKLDCALLLEQAFALDFKNKLIIKPKKLENALNNSSEKFLYSKKPYNDSHCLSAEKNQIPLQNTLASQIPSISLQETPAITFPLTYISLNNMNLGSNNSLIFITRSPLDVSPPIKQVLALDFKNNINIPPKGLVITVDNSSHLSQYRAKLLNHPFCLSKEANKNKITSSFLTQTPSLSLQNIPDRTFPAVYITLKKPHLLVDHTLVVNFAPTLNTPLPLEHELSLNFKNTPNISEKLFEKTIRDSDNTSYNVNSLSDLHCLAKETNKINLTYTFSSLAPSLSLQAIPDRTFPAEYIPLNKPHLFTNAFLPVKARQVLYTFPKFDYTTSLEFENNPKMNYRYEDSLVPTSNYIPFFATSISSGRTSFLDKIIVKTPPAYLPTITLSENIATLSPPPIPVDYLDIFLLDNNKADYCFYNASLASQTNRNNRVTNFQLAILPQLKDLKTDSLSDEFKINIKIIPQMADDGYIFALNIMPIDRENFQPLPHNIYYLLDRGSSIEKYRFEIFKKAISQSLTYLNADTSFNIIAFDKQTEKFNSKTIRATSASKKIARKYLNKLTQKHHSTFISLFNVLEDLKKKAELTNEVYTVVLLSNGHLMKNIRYHREALNYLVQDKPDNFSIYTTAISDKNNLGMLDLLAKLGRGELLHTKTHASFPRKLAVLTKRLNRPLAKDIQITNITSNSVKFIENPNYSPMLFADKLYTFYGTADKLEDINIMIQGYSNNRWMNINKKISLKDASRGNSSYEKEIALQKAFKHMVDFLFTNDHNDLYQAQVLLHPFDYPFPAK